MEKKVHWKTAQKLAKESGEVSEEVSTPEIVELEKKVAKLEKAMSRPYYIYNKSASLVGYAENEEEANEVLKSFEGGFIKLI